MNEMLEQIINRNDTWRGRPPTFRVRVFQRIAIATALRAFPLAMQHWMHNCSRAAGLWTVPLSC